MSDPALEDMRREVADLTRRLASMERTRTLRTRWLVGAALMVGSVAFAQLTVFTPDTPAYASEVNGNFNQLKTWLEQKVGPVGTPNVTITGTTNLAGATVNGTTALGATTITGTTSVTGATTITGNLTVTGRVAPNFDSGWFGVTSGNSYPVAHGLGAVPSQVQVMECGAVSNGACTTRVVYANSGFNDGSACLNPINTFSDGTNVTVALTSACNAWGYWLPVGGFQYAGDADGNTATAFYRVLAWR